MVYQLSYFARTTGSKDKKKRKSRLGRVIKNNLPLIALGATAGGLALVNRKIARSKIDDLLKARGNSGQTPQQVLNRSKEFNTGIPGIAGLFDNLQTMQVSEDFAKEAKKRVAWKQDTGRRRMLALLNAQKNPEVATDLYIARNSSKKFNSKQRQAAVKRVNKYFDRKKQQGLYCFLGDVSKF